MLKVLNRPCAAAALSAPGAAAVTASDETLVDRIAGGDKLAMQTLFAMHRTSVYRWLRRMVDETLAEDLLSEVFLDVWRQAGRFEGRSSVSTWVNVHCPLQGTIGASPSDRLGAGRKDQGHGRGPGG